MINRWNELSIKLIVPTFLLSMFACVDSVPLEVPEGSTRKIVIQGNVRSGKPAFIDINVSQSADFVEYFNAEKISGASVSIFDGSERKLNIPEVEPGVYQLEWSNNADFEVLRGGTYQLQVELPNGSKYASDYEYLYGVPEPKAIHVNLEIRNVLNEAENIVTTPFIQFLVDTPLKHPEEESKAYFKWTMEGVFRLIELPAPIPIPGPKTCFISDALALDQVIIFNGFEASGNNLERHMIFEEAVNWNYSAGYYLTVYQQSLSKGAYEYWSQVQEVSAREGSLFESPPGRIQSNIRNIDNQEEQVLGYFYATEVDTIRRLVSAEDANYPGQPCTIFTYEEAPDYCRNCLLWPNSSTVKPNYWVE